MLVCVLECVCVYWNVCVCVCSNECKPAVDDLTGESPSGIRRISGGGV